MSNKRTTPLNRFDAMAGAQAMYEDMHKRFAPPTAKVLPWTGLTAAEMNQWVQVFKTGVRAATAVPKRAPYSRRIETGR